jgi:hypothetical protein
VLFRSAGIVASIFGWIVEKVIKKFFRSDAGEMLAVYNKEFIRLCKKYSVTRNELLNLLEKITIEPYDLRALFVRVDKESYAYNYLEKYFIYMKYSHRIIHKCI